MKVRLTKEEMYALVDHRDVVDVGKEFLINHFGKYAPNVTYILAKEVWVDENGAPVCPIEMFPDKELGYSTNLIFDGNPSFLFGDFWRSRKGGACFRPKDPEAAKHMLIRVDWGGSCNPTNGKSFAEAKAQAGEDLLYFRRASSNGGGTGYDFWVLPIGYVAQRYIPGIDGPEAPGKADWSQNAAWVRKEYQKRLDASRKRADQVMAERKAADEKSAKARAAFLPRLNDLNATLDAVREETKEARVEVSRIVVNDTSFYYHSKEYHFNEDSMLAVERRVDDTVRFARRIAAERAAQKEAEDFWTPIFQATFEKAAHNGAKLIFNDHQAILEYSPWQKEYIPYTGEGYLKLRNNLKKEESK